MPGDPTPPTSVEREGWHLERSELLARLAAETAAVAELTQQLQDLTELHRLAARPEPSPARDASARLLAREVVRHEAEVVLLKDAERAALCRVEDLNRQLRELRGELQLLQTEHATERMRTELEIARLSAEAAGLQAAARRRAELSRPTPQEREARLARQRADEELRAAADGPADSTPEAVDVPDVPDVADVPAGPDVPAVRDASETGPAPGGGGPADAPQDVDQADVRPETDETGETGETGETDRTDVLPETRTTEATETHPTPETAGTGEPEPDEPVDPDDPLDAAEPVERADAPTAPDATREALPVQEPAPKAESVPRARRLTGFWRR